MWNNLRESFLCILWISMTVAALLVCFLKPLSSIKKHGKLNVSTIRYLTVPKQYFSHFYAMGIASGVVALLVDEIKLDRISLILFSMFEIHMIRRQWESKTITIYGQSTMHVGGYFCGLVHYLGVSVTLLSPNQHYKAVHYWQIVVSFIFYILGSYAQCKCHYILYLIKKRNPHMKYQIPKGFWFDYICCPHYLAEIIIYSSYLVLRPERTSALLLFVWVSCNLSIVSNEHYIWYNNSFGKDNVPKLWRRLIPFVW